mmetsp:Transcript_27151/g.40103  ORF Transcript_27151/g.40103 Transcript_27151/m.40103 type:complete len:207 (-) Transcript_27151:147-767(-)|eukprot:CAMPEP_0194202170 /NCGR_PEP_ID=MMETSP0156-20130528/2267_1 /TAXON_ID=33649 /ORGANISM="Thalassionema nitzschioides, Strain L26-B" /LENGTH=206 /DNA_ID=CAMNT_0038927585 /DNA_START=114 /DNA_END=734 /DNA_ORIENTATION=-
MSTNRKHELLYFDGPGRAETIRICLHAGGVDFTDTRFQGKDWPSIKPTTPLGSVPVLKVDGVSHCQSVSLARYAGKLGGFYPLENHLEALIVDEAMDSMNELMAAAPQNSDETELLKLRKEFQEGAMTKYATFLEGLIQSNGGTGFVSTPSIADLTLWGGTVKGVASGDWTGIDSDFFDKYEGIIATVASIEKNEKVVAYYASLGK